jgi:hypothetical protein
LEIPGKSSGTITILRQKIGYTEFVITPDMIGSKVAIFTAGEVKTGNQKLNDDQERFKAQVLAAGGIFEVWREPENRMIWRNP